MKSTSSFEAYTRGLAAAAFSLLDTTHKMASQLMGSNVRLPTRSPAFRSQQPRTAVSRPSVGSNMHGSSYSSGLGTAFGMPSASSSRTANRRVVTMAAKGKLMLSERCSALQLSRGAMCQAHMASVLPLLLSLLLIAQRAVPTAVTGKIKLELVAGKANPSPPVGPALGAKVCAVCSSKGLFSWQGTATQITQPQWLETPFGF